MAVVLCAAVLSGMGIGLGGHVVLKLWRIPEPLALKGANSVLAFGRGGVGALTLLRFSGPVL